jgi:peroxiredoxin
MLYAERVGKEFFMSTNTGSDVEVKNTLQDALNALEAQTAERISPEIHGKLRKMVLTLVQEGIEDRVLRVGQLAKDFTLPDPEGKPINLNTLLKDGPVILAFYRGTWCPFCNLTLRTYQSYLESFKALGAQLVAISPQTPDKSMMTVEKLNLTFPVLSDVGNHVARSFGLVFTLPEPLWSLFKILQEYNGDDSFQLPIPALFVIAPDRTVKVSFASADYVRRMEPLKIIQSLSQLEAVGQPT